MKISRVSAATLTFAALSLLAACGGGGGGGGGVNPPGGGGGGGGPTPTPVGSTQPTPTPTPVSTSTPSGTTVKAEENFVNGSYAWYTSGTASWNNGAAGDAGDPSNAPAGKSVDGMSCTNVNESTGFTGFAQHVFVGIYFNGTWEAMPQGLGMVDPVAPIGTGNPPHTANTQEIEQNKCEYNMHTHDYSGLIHIEDASLPQSNTSFPSYANLQSFLDVAGASLSATGFSIGASQLAGPVTIYTGKPSTQVSGNDEVTSYSVYTGSLKSLMFSKHSAFWIVVGTPPTSLPNVEFVIVN